MSGYADLDLVAELLSKMKGQTGFETVAKIILHSKILNDKTIKALLDHN